MVVGSRGLADGRVELSLRRDGVKRSVPLGDTVAEVQSLLAELRSTIES